MDSDLRDLLMAWFGTDLGEARHQELLDRLARDDEFRQGFVAEVRLLGMLRAVQSPESRWLRLEDELGWSAQGPTFDRDRFADRVVDRLEPSGADDPPPLFLTPTADASADRPAVELLVRHPRRRWRKPASALAASVALLAGGLAWWSGRLAGPPSPTRPTEVVTKTQTPAFPKVPTTEGLAMVVRLDGVRWESDGVAHPREGDVLPSGHYRFAAGRAQLMMLTGVVLDVEGPADLELVESEKVLCHRGRLRARVPAGAEGFLVLGPGSAIVDLGTEFGVNVDNDGRMHGQIFRGRLEAALLNESGTSQRSYFLDADRANATKAFAVDPHTKQIAAVAASTDFAAASELTVPPLPLGRAYRASVLASRPWGYWRFESQVDGTTPNEVAGGPPLRLVGPVRLVPSAPEGHAVEFPAPSPTEPQLLQLDGEWRPTWDSGFAVEFWASSRAIAHASLASLISPVGTDHHVFLLETTSRNRLTIHKPASIRLLHRFPPGWEGGENTYSNGPYVPFRWQHVVGQIRGNLCELFVDGVLAATIPVTVDHAEVACQFILGRLSARAGTGLSVDRPFVGLMDEVALYDHPLTALEVQAHHALGTASGEGGDHESISRNSAASQ